MIISILFDKNFMIDNLPYQANAKIKSLQMIRYDHYH